MHAHTQHEKDLEGLWSPTRVRLRLARGLLGPGPWGAFVPYRIAGGLLGPGPWGACVAYRIADKDSSLPTTWLLHSLL